MSNHYIRRTYEPLKFLGRLFWVPMAITRDTKKITYAPTWEADGSRWGPTLIFRFPFTEWGVGLGVWLDVNQDSIVPTHDEDVEYDTYVAVNGPVDRSEYDAARKKVASMGLDPDEEMEAMQALGIFK